MSNNVTIVAPNVAHVKTLFIMPSSLKEFADYRAAGYAKPKPKPPLLCERRPGRRRT
jgi:hypothetical protein